MKKVKKKLEVERLSVFDIFKIGVGPSSSHTLGPWVAARQFVAELGERKLQSLKIHLYGSLSLTGKGHYTHYAAMLGLEDFDPKTIDTSKINDYIDRIADEKTLNIPGNKIPFDPDTDIVFEKYSLDFHPNAMTFEATHQDGKVEKSTFYSVGGGFIVKDGETKANEHHVVLPYPVDSGKELIAHTENTGLSISGVVWENEKVFQSEEETRKNILEIWRTMEDSIFRGCNTGGILPGGLNVTRRAKAMSESLLGGKTFSNVEDWRAAIRETGKEYDNVNKWLSCFALAVNEENAAMGRIVTSPTNGAAGIIPAVLMHYTCFEDYKGEDDIVRFLMTAGEIGCIFKKNATISAAMGGCQAETGVASAMSAGAIAELKGADPKRVLMAAEIAMEHHLGLTCDPVMGLVQIPCIERNTMGANKALTAANLALSGNPEDAIVDFDTVVETMWATALDMLDKYKETSQGGLAIHVSQASPNC